MPPMTPARQHYLRTMAEQEAAQAAANNAPMDNATEYELQLAQLTDDRRNLKNINSIKLKIQRKVDLLPKYAAWVDGVLASASGVQDDVLMTVMIWRIDVGDLVGALPIAQYAIEHDLKLPDQYQRNAACLIAEEFADTALRILGEVANAADKDAIVSALLTIGELTAEKDMPDEVQAKLFKAVAYALLASIDVEPAPDDAKQLETCNHALEAFRRAVSFNDKVGVKKDIERLEARIKKLTPAS